ncbi:Gfo/Idh/MocA family oxidoreductase [Flavicella sediminum]|uniref:Gfo/Idh/MocA family oxidoreductase n=1 Tax=Flavicella sediminum TaxID=2585141 RepID=UPI001120C388|nr:Gfo/Idh/MocA family oxidoreductase [Flavicella sediminum]
MNLIKTGVLSYGMSGSLFHCPFLNLHPEFELTAIVERSSKKAQAVYPTLKSYASVDEILGDSEIELVVVNTPSPTHFEFALKAVQAGKHVLVEKPFCVTSEQAKIIFLEAKKQNCLVMPFQNRRYDSDFLSVKKVVESGKLGTLIEAHFRYDRYNFEISDHKTKEANVPGNDLLYNLGAHVVDAAIALFGIPVKWRKVKKCNRPNSKIADYAYVHMEFANGLQVFTTVSLLVADEQPGFILHGTKGSYVKKRCDVQERQLKLGMSPNEERFGKETLGMEGVLTTVEKGVVKKEKIISEPSNYLHVFEDVFQCIRNKKAYAVTEEQVVRQLEILEDN